MWSVDRPVWSFRLPNVVCPSLTCQRGLSVAYWIRRDQDPDPLITGETLIKYPLITGVYCTPHCSIFYEDNDPHIHASLESDKQINVLKIGDITFS